MTELEKTVADELRRNFCILRNAHRMVCVDPDEVAKVAVGIVAQELQKTHQTLPGSVLLQLWGSEELRAKFEQHVRPRP